MLNYKSQGKERAPKIGAKQVRFPSLDESNRQKYFEGYLTTMIARKNT